MPGSETAGMWYMQKTRTWQWGGERPFFTLRPYLHRFSRIHLSEYSIAGTLSLNYLTMPMGRLIKKVLAKPMSLIDYSNPTLLRQGYLLVTVVDKI